jgi:hypothetical protein
MYNLHRMKYTFLIIIPILLGCSNGTDNESSSQIDSLTSIIRAKNIEITLLKEELANSQGLIQKLEDDQLKTSLNKQSGCECNIDFVRIAKQSIPNLTEDILLGLLCTFSDKCKNNAEFGQFSNSTLHEIISQKPELFIYTIHKNIDEIKLRTILNEVETPIHDDFDLQANYQSIKEVYGYDSTKDSVLASMEISMDKGNINYFKGDDCIFDLATQTDEFLQGIPELENYVWNKHINTGKIQLEGNETLYISRGGCNHFGASADFHIAGKEINLEQALEKIIWIAELLKDEFEVELLKEAIENKEYKTENLSYISFSNQRLSDLTYSMSFRQDSEESKISLSWYMN